MHIDKAHYCSPPLPLLELPRLGTIDDMGYRTKESVTMITRYKQTFRIGILALSLLSSSALADPAEDLERANAFYVKHELGDAYEILRKLAEQNYAPAQARLGEILDITEEDETAVGWFLMAAIQGDASGAYGLGKMYLTGEGIKKDLDQALFWIKYAAEKDNLDAIRAMEIAYRTGGKSGLPVTIDLKQAQFWEAKKIPMEAALRKMEEEKKQAALTERYERQEARKKADKEAAEKAEQGKAK